MKDGLLHKNSSSLAREEVDALFVRWRGNGDERAREQLVENFLPLAYSLARRYRGAREPIGDLRQVAALGLLKALNNYDADRGSPFAAYAVPSILGELRRYFRDSGWAVHLPRGIQDLALKVDKGRRELEALHPVVTAQMIAEYLELTVEDVLEATEAASAHHASSLDAPADDSPDAPTVAHSIGEVDPGYAGVELNVDLERASGVLTDQERLVLSRRFEADLTQAEIAAELGVSQMQISRILRRALQRLSQVITEESAEDL